ncbi:MAG: hypothetical protein AUK31_01645 [Fibrobacteres bacterium CG2_30_45_31]|nr:MAG: hypothetical protein AUK31_01645 [Fibrobacteres bacterium CG2_30_45_31]
MKAQYGSLMVTGSVVSVNVSEALMRLKLLSGEEIDVGVSRNTQYEVLRNVGDESRDRVPKPDEEEVERLLGSRDKASDAAMWDAKRSLFKYIKVGIMVSIRGVASRNGEVSSFSARRVVLMGSIPRSYGWEETHWWLQQINTLFEQWMDVLFKDKRELTENDFSGFYRTNLDLSGDPTSDDTQECATMSRFLYGLSSSYLLTGNDRAFSAAKACAHYLINAFSVLTHDHMYCFWKFSRKHDGKSMKDIISSKNGDDNGTYALYEQIYALAGLTQYYRITQDTNILFYITRTINSFEKFYRDEKRNNDPCFTGKGGYFSHIDPVTMRPDAEVLGQNKMRKNWNSIGDHIPAYLVNLLLAIDPLPKTAEQDSSWENLLVLCRKMLDDCVENILTHFPPQDGSKFVNERFFADWTPDHSWGWQQDRGIVGHNLKISWNLTRCAHYYLCLSHNAAMDGSKNEGKYKDLADRCYATAKMLGHNMEEVGVDLIRGGIYDALERHPSNGMPTEFAWESTKDFWQQEQAILAYYIMVGIKPGDEESARFLELARYCAAFWNLYFVDQKNRNIYFRTTESGSPIVQNGYDIQGGHAIAGYHSFELNYLAHLYIRTYVPSASGDESFTITFRPKCNNGIRTLNVLPDFFRPGDLKILGIKVNGMPRSVQDAHRFQVDISDIKEESEVEVEFLPIRRTTPDLEARIQKERAGIADINFAK